MRTEKTPPILRPVGRKETSPTCPYHSKPGTEHMTAKPKVRLFQQTSVRPAKGTAVGSWSQQDQLTLCYLRLAAEMAVFIELRCGMSFYTCHTYNEGEQSGILQLGLTRHQ